MGSANNALFIATLAFGVISLGITAGVQVVKGKGFTSSFVKLYGLLFVATLAAAITFGGVDGETRTGAYTILGTIAGYLAGSRATTAAADNRTGGGSAESVL